MKTGLLILLILIILCVGIGVVRRTITRLISNTASPPEINIAKLATAPAEDEEGDPEDMWSPEGDEVIPFEEWPTNQDWFGDLYPNSEYLKPQVQFSSF